MSARLQAGRAHRLALVTSFVLGCSALGCGKKDAWFQTTVTIEKIQPVKLGPDAKPLHVDVQFNYPECPGEQTEVIRGSAAFAGCMASRKVGDTVPVRILRHWDPKGFWDWDVHEMAGCPRPPDPDDEASFDQVQECEPVLVNDVPEGFTCNRVPEKQLLQKCPWFAR